MSDLVGNQIVGFLMHRLILLGIAWVKVFRIMPEFRIFDLDKGHFCESCKSEELAHFVFLSETPVAIIYL